MIYFVEDDSSIRELVVYTLSSMGFEAAGFSEPKVFWKEMENSKPELLLLDLMLPGEDGITILKKIRNTPGYKNIPVIILTARDSEYDKVVGLDSGADDYITKPFGMMELVARIKAVLRRQSTETGGELKYKKLVVSVSGHTVSVNSLPVKLTLKEFVLLQYVMEYQNRVFSRDQLLDKIWGYSFDGENRTVDVHIRTLRQKLGEAGEYVSTVRGIGYKFGEE